MGEIMSECSCFQQVFYFSLTERWHRHSTLVGFDGGKSSIPTNSEFDLIFFPPLLPLLAGFWDNHGESGQTVGQLSGWRALSAAGTNDVFQIPQETLAGFGNGNYETFDYVRLNPSAVLYVEVKCGCSCPGML